MYIRTMFVRRRNIPTIHKDFSITYIRTGIIRTPRRLQIGSRRTVYLDHTQTTSSHAVRYRKFERLAQKIADRPFIRIDGGMESLRDRKSTRLNSSHVAISYA